MFVACKIADNMEINEHRNEQLEKLLKDFPMLEECELDKSLGKIENIKHQKSDDVSFKGRMETERDIESSKLQDELRNAHIYPGELYSDKLWGGLDSFSGDLVHNALNEARNSNRITDSEYKNLMAQLKKACHHQN